MFCPQCGNELIGNPNFCTRCGSRLTETMLQSTLGAAPLSSIEQLCRGFYDGYIFKAFLLGDMDGWAFFLDNTFKSVAEADPSFAGVDRSQFQREMTALRMELFLLALSRSQKDKDTSVTARYFTKQFLEEIGSSDLSDIMYTYNQMLAESTVRDAYGQRPRGRKAEALFASTDKARLDWYYGWIDAHIGEPGKQNPPDMTDEEMELLDCAGPVSNHIGVDIRKNDCIAVKMLSWRLVVHLGSNHKLKRKALEVLQATIFGFYLGAEEYLRNPEHYQRGNQRQHPEPS